MGEGKKKKFVWTLQSGPGMCQWQPCYFGKMEELGSENREEQ